MSNENQFVAYYDETGNLIGGGGYLLDIPLFKNIQNPFIGGTKKNKKLDEENIKNQDPEYIIPAGLYYKEVESVQTYSPDSFIYKERDVIDDKLYNELYDLATFDFNENSQPKKNLSKKNRKQKSKNKKTRKHK